MQKPPIKSIAPSAPGLIRLVRAALSRMPVWAHMVDYVKSWVVRAVSESDADMERWFLQWIMNRNRAFSGVVSKKVYFEFGVYEGDSLVRYISAAKRFCHMYDEPLTDFHIYAFDSFCGLPEKKEGDDVYSWYKGKFACDIETVRKRIIGTGFPESNLFLIPGFYEESLTDDLRQELLRDSGIPHIVNVDCDYYSSAKTVLEWLRPLLLSGTIFFFHDIWSFCGHPNMGELRAINEFNHEGDGYLRQWGQYGFSDHTYVYSAKEWEFGENSQFNGGVSTSATWH